MKSKVLLVICFICATASLCFAQEYPATANKLLEIEGLVAMQTTKEPIVNARITVFGGTAVRTNLEGRFKIKAAIGDEILIEHADFQTVYYTIKGKDEIRVYVQEELADTEDDEIKPETKLSKSKISSKRLAIDLNARYNDSAELYKKTDIAKSILYVEKALNSLGNTVDREKQARSFSVLGDVYMYWKQYDLAASNYAIAINTLNSNEVAIKLAQAQLLMGDAESAKQGFSELSANKLSNYQKIMVYEGLGDANTALGLFVNAERAYQNALKIATTNLVSPKITDLNTKLAGLFAKKGAITKAEGYFKNSLQLASEENVERAVKQKEIVADFYSSSNQYDKEIALRKENLQAIVELNDSTTIYLDAPEAITPQKSNYKIGSAFLNQRKYSEAKPFLEESIKEANSRKDLIIKKDAVRKLSEVYGGLGDYEKAYSTYREYVELVDSLVVKKEQQISQASRFSRDLALQQNRITSLEKDRELSEGKMQLISKDRELQTESNKRQQLTIYGLIIGMLLLLAVAFYMYRSIKQQKLANNLLALKSLRSQMNPHFIFNALNSVNSYISTNDERKANRYLADFSKLMRSVLENSENDFIPLSKEIELLELYTKLEHSRFESSFDYQIIIDKKIDLEDFKIPPMILQPYLENAVWHGLRYKKEKGKLLVSMTQISPDTLEIIIEDDGIGRAKSAALKTENQLKQKSKGMGNIQERIHILNEMYQDKVNVNVADAKADGTGTKVVVTLKKD
jgi:tetratricopeptide (TPR) repeat protein